MLVDIRVTADGEFVCFHDADLGAELSRNIVRNTDGTYLTAEEKAQTIASLTLSELDEYDFGIYKGAEYAGTKILRLDEFLEWCGLMNCVPMLEIKVLLTEAQCVQICNMCKMYGLGDRVIIDEYGVNLATTLAYWTAILPKDATICAIAGASSLTTIVGFMNAIINAGLNALVTISTTAQLATISTDGVIDYDKVRTITNTGAGMVYTEIESEQTLSDFYDEGYLSVFKFIASSYVMVNEWIKEHI